MRLEAATNKMRFINLFKSSVLAVPAVFAAVGCGGSSGVSNGFPSSPSSVGNPTGPGTNGGSAMVTLTPGRTFVYAVSGTITKDYLDSSGTKKTDSGAVTNATLTREISDGSGVIGSAAFQVTDTLTYTLQGQTPAVEVSTWYAAQASDGSLTIVGANQYNYLTEPSGTIPFAPGTFSTSLNLSSGITQIGFPNDPPVVVSYLPTSGSGPTVSYSIIPGDGTIETAFTALSQESVPTTTGAPFTAWKTQYSQTSVFNNNGLYRLAMQEVLSTGFVNQSHVAKTVTDDWVPSIGAPVRSHIVLNESDQVTTSYQYSFGSYTTTPSITYTSQALGKKETLDMVLTSQH